MFIIISGILLVAGVILGIKLQIVFQILLFVLAFMYLKYDDGTKNHGHSVLISHYSMIIVLGGIIAGDIYFYFRYGQNFHSIMEGIRFLFSP